MKPTKELQVGDVIYCYSIQRGLVKDNVRQVTQNTAILSSGIHVARCGYLLNGDYEFKQLGDYARWYLQTKELEQEFKLQHVRRRTRSLFDEINVDVLTMEECERIISAVTAAIHE